MKNNKELISDDWISNLTGDFRDEFCSNIHSLSLNRLQKYPPSKSSGLPLGHEGRVLIRFLKGNSSQLDESAFSYFYRMFGSSRDKSLYSAFVDGEMLAQEDWIDLIGKDAFNIWIKNKLLREAKKGEIQCSFRVISINNMIFIVDPFRVAFPYKIFIGQCTINIIEFISKYNINPGSRYLDVGSGSGAVLQHFSKYFKEAIGIDINPRAVSAAKMNIKLNEKTNCTIYDQDVFKAGSNYGSFDMITWNTPFVFFPEHKKESNLDGYGGHMGIELTLKFIKMLPELLAQKGTAYLLSSAPVLKDGTNVLEDSLEKLLKKIPLDISLHVIQLYWRPEQQEMHDHYNITQFESVFIKINHGSGMLRRFNSSFARRIIDTFRGFMYRCKK